LRNGRPCADLLAVSSERYQSENESRIRRQREEKEHKPEPKIKSLTILRVIQQNGGVQPLLHQLERALPHLFLPVGGAVAPSTDTGRNLEDVHGPKLTEGAFHRVFCDNDGGRRGRREGGREGGDVSGWGNAAPQPFCDLT